MACRIMLHFLLSFAQRPPSVRQTFNHVQTAGALDLPSHRWLRPHIGGLGSQNGLGCSCKATVKRVPSKCLFVVGLGPWQEVSSAIAVSGGGLQKLSVHQQSLVCHSYPGQTLPQLSWSQVVTGGHSRQGQICSSCRGQRGRCQGVWLVGICHSGSFNLKPVGWGNDITTCRQGRLLFVPMVRLE